MADAKTREAEPKTDRFFRRFGFGVIGAVFGGLILWSIVAPIHGAVLAPGQIVVESNRKAVQHLQGGMIGEILVREGQHVEEGEVIVRLEDTVQKSNLGLIDGQLTELYARRARLQAERDGADRLPPAQGVGAVLLLESFNRALAGQQQLFEARRTTRVTQIALLEERINQQSERITGLGAQIESLDSQSRIIGDELAGVRELNREGFSPMTRVRALEREEKRLEGDRGARLASIAEAESISSEAELEVTRLRETTREEAITELRDVEVRIAEMEERRISAALALQQTEINAPRSGRVMGLAVHTVGGVIAPGTPIMEIVPEGDRLQISARISPRDVDKVAPGQKTYVRFTSFRARTTPEVNGIVKNVSADSFTDEHTGAPFYLVVIELPDDEELRRVLNGQVLSPGMPAESFIRTGSQPVVAYLLKPLMDALSRSMREE